jgi:hypothetical protein
MLDQFQSWMLSVSTVHGIKTCPAFHGSQKSCYTRRRPKVRQHQSKSTCAQVVDSTLVLERGQWLKINLVLLVCQSANQIYLCINPFIILILYSIHLKLEAVCFFSRFSIFAMIYLGVFQKNYEIVNCGPTAHTRVNHPTVQPNKTKARTRESSSRGAAVTRRRLRTLKIPCEFPRMPSSWSGHNPLVPWDQPPKGEGIGRPLLPHAKTTPRQHLLSCRVQGAARRRRPRHPSSVGLHHPASVPRRAEGKGIGAPRALSGSRSGCNLKVFSLRLPDFAAGAAAAAAVQALGCCLDTLVIWRGRIWRSCLGLVRVEVRWRRGQVQCISPC